MRLYLSQIVMLLCLCACNSTEIKEIQVYERGNKHYRYVDRHNNDNRGGAGYKLPEKRRSIDPTPKGIEYKDILTDDIAKQKLDVVRQNIGQKSKIKENGASKAGDGSAMINNSAGQKNNALKQVQKATVNANKDKRHTEDMSRNTGDKAHGVNSDVGVTSKVGEKSKAVTKIDEKEQKAQPLPSVSGEKAKANNIAAKNMHQNAASTANSKSTADIKAGAAAAGVAGRGVNSDGVSKSDSGSKKINKNDDKTSSNVMAGSSGFLLPHPLNNKKFIWPVNGKVLKHMRQQAPKFNEGISIAAPQGTLVKATAAGTVLYVEKDGFHFGSILVIKHDDGYLSAYGHASEFLVKKGDVVKRGEYIAKVGKTGDVSVPQLFFSIRYKKEMLDPEKSF